ncbi:MAG: hypothetical protein GX657_07855 [Chloroflexi bacterium]|nr:hypothetical protein [Chloroflexota bacterium]
MRVYNRVVVTLASVLVAVVAVVFLITPARVLNTLDNTLTRFTGGVTGGGAYWTVTVIVAVLVVLLALAVVALEVTPRRQQRVRIRAQGRGNARLRVDSVAQTLEYRIDELEGVRKVVPRLTSHGKDIAVLLEVDASPNANVPALSDLIIDRTIRILEGELGLQIHGRVNLDISHEPYPVIPGVAPVIGYAAGRAEAPAVSSAAAPAGEVAAPVYAPAKAEPSAGAPPAAHAAPSLRPWTEPAPAAEPAPAEPKPTIPVSPKPAVASVFVGAEPVVAEPHAEPAPSPAPEGAEGPYPEPAGEGSDREGRPAETPQDEGARQDEQPPAEWGGSAL